MQTTATGRYRVTRHPDGTITVHDVPIFAECFRAPKPRADGTMPAFDGNFNAAWIREAVRNAQQRHSEGFFGPVHVRHHEKTAVGEEARRAGTFQVTGTSVIRYEGQPRLAVMADITLTDESAQFDVLKERVPYRSIETLHPATRPEFDSLALLDHEVPFLRLPNMTIGEVDDQSSEDGAVPCGTFSEPWEMGALDDAGPMVAYFSQGERTALLFREEPMTKTKTKPAEKFGAGVDVPGVTGGKITDPEAFLKFTDDTPADKAKKPKPKDDDSTDMEDGDGGFDIGALLKQVAAGELPFKDMMALQDALTQAMASTAPEEPTPEQPAPAAVPGGEAMRAAQEGSVTPEQFAELKAAQITDRVEVRKLRHDAARTRAVAAAKERTDGRILTDIEPELVQYFDECGGNERLFKMMVDSLCKHNGIAPELDTDPDVKIATGNFSEEAMKFADDGADAVEMAEGFVRQHEWAKKTMTSMRISLADFVANRMARAAKEKAQSA